MRLRLANRGLTISFAVSIGVLTVLLAFVDVDHLRRQFAAFDWRYGPHFAGLIAMIIAAFALRWRLLLSRRIGFGYAAHGTAVGLGGNMVLPARGGDLLRAIYAARLPSIGMHGAVSTLFLEKVIDLLFVAAVGLAAISAQFGTGRGGGAQSAAIITAVMVLSAAAALLLLARRGSLVPLVRRLFRIARIGPTIYRHAYGPLNQLARATRARALAEPIAITLLLWCLLYPLAYWIVGRMVSVPLGYGESVILVFAGALGLALPAAPSGLGTFHASVVSGFVLLGRDPSEGLALAVAIHAAFFIGLVVPGAVAYALRPLGASRSSVSGLQ